MGCTIEQNSIRIFCHHEMEMENTLGTPKMVLQNLTVKTINIPLYASNLKKSKNCEN